MFKFLRLTLASEMFGNKDLLKAIAFSMFVRHHLGKNIIKNYSVNRIAVATGIHACTVKKRMDTLSEVGLVVISDGRASFCSIVSKHIKRNVRLTKICYKSLKTVEKSLQAILIAILQLRKEFAKRVIRTARDGRSPKEIKTAQKLSRRHGWANKYAEKGMSYANIARKIGISVKTAVEIVKFAVKRRILTKFTHFEATYMPGVRRREVDGYLFTTRNYAFNVSANTYSVAKVMAV